MDAMGCTVSVGSSQCAALSTHTDDERGLPVAATLKLDGQSRVKNSAARPWNDPNPGALELELELELELLSSSVSSDSLLELRRDRLGVVVEWFESSVVDVL